MTASLSKNRGRYAPSPTGELHLGNARTALVAWWQIRAKQGQFILRIEDLDSQRSQVGMDKRNLEELSWLGLDWDEGPDIGGNHQPYAQSQRHAHYQKALEHLKAQGKLFECYLSRKELRTIASAPHGPLPPYGTKERQLNALKAANPKQSKQPSWRFMALASSISFYDHIMGTQTFDVGDFVVRRADQEWAYQLAVVVDDISMNITDITRGADLLASTALQLMLYDALAKPPPDFFHIPLLLDEEGERMAKRKGSLTLSSLRAKGVKPKRLIGLLAFSLGLIESAREVSAYEALDFFALSKLSKSPFCLTKEHLDWLFSESYGKLV